ncbi:MAG: hypothetical protein ABFD25_05665 [Clostridiaceae bacterium]
MAIIIETELQSDLEVLYKIAGDLLNEIERKEYENNPRTARQLIEKVKFTLEDMTGTLQKDIFNLRHAVMKMQTGGTGA